MIFGAILAGGVGSRMNIAEMPKQFLPLGEKPIIIHTIEKFLMCSKIDFLYVGVHPDWVLYTNDLLEKFLPQKKVTTVAGGSDRNGTMLNVIEKIEDDHGINNEHIILTHDAVRPFVTLRIIEENIEMAIKYGAVDTAVAAIDTIVVSKDGQTISDIPQRNQMYQGQTPQSFNMSMLKKLYEDLTEEEKATLTDACKICVVRKTPVKIVEGEISNLKITTVSDYKIAQAMLINGGK
ncbi:MAG: 2-C-methyl-D-erythritol 4-phosphate cytidylyltransferase [Oscillospiraceae bacterium]